MTKSETSYHEFWNTLLQWHMAQCDNVTWHASGQPTIRKEECLLYLLCKAWVRSQLRWAWNWLKLNVTSSNVLRIIIHWLSARRDAGLTQGSLTPKEHSLYRALKHSIHQHKLDLNLSKTKQPLSIITNSHLRKRRKQISSRTKLNAFPQRLKALTQILASPLI